MTVDVAITLELCHWFSPSCRIWVTGCDVPGSRPSWEEPDIDVRTGPFCSDDSTTNVIEVVAVGLRVLVLDVAAGVRTLAWSVNVAVGGAKSAGEAAVVIDRTPIGSV